MVAIIADAFYLAQIVGLNVKMKEDRLVTAIEKLMTDITTFYNTPEQASDDIEAFAKQVNVKARLSFEVDGKRVPEAPEEIN